MTGRCHYSGPADKAGQSLNQGLTIPQTAHKNHKSEALTTSACSDRVGGCLRLPGSFLQLSLRDHRPNFLEAMMPVLLGPWLGDLSGGAVRVVVMKRIVNERSVAKSEVNDLDEARKPPMSTPASYTGMWATSVSSSAVACSRPR